MSVCVTTTDQSRKCQNDSFRGMGRILTERDGNICTADLGSAEDIVEVDHAPKYVQRMSAHNYSDTHHTNLDASITALCTHMMVMLRSASLLYLNAYSVPQLALTEQ